MPSESSPLLNKQSGSSQHSNYESLPSPRRPRTRVSNLRYSESPSGAPRSFSPQRLHKPSSVNSEESVRPSSESEHLKWSQRVPYYLPCYSWLPSYNCNKFFGDLVAGLSLASFQIPLALSYATAIAHVPALCGLYSLAIPPIIYAVFGSVPQMIVGPEGAISLVVGQAVEPLMSHDKHVDPVDLVSVLSCIGGFYLLGAGLCRFGFLDNVLSRALLRGFISAVGIVMIINSLYDELGLNLIKDIPAHFHSPVKKFIFIFETINRSHRPTAIISLVSFVLIQVTQHIKGKLIKKGYNRWVFLPEILIVVVSSTILSAVYDWKSLGVAVVGKIKTKGFSYKFPISKETMPLYHSLMSSGFLAATLGFFESTTASKSLGSAYDLPISSNRELVALGSINLCGGIIGALPAFGGYGRSRINAISGAQTTMSGLIMGSVTLITIFFLLDYIYYLPQCVLSVITTIVGLKLLDETPADLRFHIRAKGYSELITFCITITATLLYSVEAGIALGVGYSVIRVIKNSTKSGIQILGRLPNTNTFLNADEPLPEDQGEFLEEIEGCMIVKIAEPLTFSNASDLKLRLMRLERYGSAKTHPAAPRTREDSMNKHILFDLNGMTYFDSSAAQIFYEILEAYKKKSIHVYLIRVPTKHGIRKRIKNSGITDLTDGKFYNSIDEVMMLLDNEEASQIHQVPDTASIV